MGTLNWGFLGAGGIAKVIARDFQLAGLNIQAVGARELANANAFADQFGIPNRHEGYQALVSDDSVDAIYISTPQTMHHRDAMLALSAGKHVLLEKPFTINAKEARELQATAKKHGVFLMEAMWTRFLPSMQAAMQVIRSGKIGRVIMLSADHSQYLPRERKERLWSPALGGGALLDLGVYPISFASSLFGTPSKIQAAATLSPEGLDEITTAIFSYQDGSQAAVTTCMTSAGPSNATVFGTEGRIELAGAFYEQTSFQVFNSQKELIQEYRKGVPGRGMQYQALEVERCVAEGLTESPLMTLDESISIMETMDTIRNITGVRYPTER